MQRDSGESRDEVVREKRYPRAFIGGGRSSACCTITQGFTISCFDGCVSIIKDGIKTDYRGTNGWVDEGRPVIDGEPVIENDPRFIQSTPYESIRMRNK